MSFTRNPNTNCLICNKPIYKRKSQIERNKGRVFCSVLCYGKSIRKEKPCLMCGNLIMAKFNKKTCSRVCANKHRTGIKYKLSLLRKDKVVHDRSIKLRLIKARGTVCELCGYNKTEILHVHHKDRNHRNNHLENLILLCPNCHYEEHYLNKSWLKDFLG